MSRPSAPKLVLLVSVILIAALPAGAGAETIDRSFGNWTATFSGTFDYEWSEPDPEPCYPNGDGSVRARFSGRLGEFEISYLRKGAFSTFGLGSNTTRVGGSVTEIAGINDDMVSTQDVFVFQKTGVGLNGRVLGRFTATGIRPAFMERLRTSGINLPPTLFSHSVDI